MDSHTKQHYYQFHLPTSMDASVQDELFSHNWCAWNGQSRYYWYAGHISEVLWSSLKLFCMWSLPLHPPQFWEEKDTLCLQWIHLKRIKILSMHLLSVLYLYYILYLPLVNATRNLCILNLNTCILPLVLRLNSGHNTPNVALPDHQLFFLNTALSGHHQSSIQIFFPAKLWFTPRWLSFPMHLCFLLYPWKLNATEAKINPLIRSFKQHNSIGNNNI